MRQIKLTELKVSAKARKRVDELLSSGNIGQGPLIQEFEEKFAAWVGAKHAIAVSSGTMADTIAVAVIKNLNNENDRVLIPALTFAAHLNSVLYNGLKPVFYDIDENTVDLRNDFLIHFPVHLLGTPRLCDFYKKTVIEDTCEAMGSSIDGKKCGTFGDMGTFSFFPSHTMTTGEGGMIVTNRDDYSELARRLRNHGKNSGLDFHFDVVGFNGKMTSIQAALGIEALKTIDESIEKRRENWIFLGGREMPGVYVSPHAFPVFLNSKEERDAMMKKLNENGIECRNLFSSLPTQETAYKFLGHKLGDFPESERIGDCGLYVPCHQYLKKEDLKRIKGIIDEKETQKTTVLE